MTVFTAGFSVDVRRLSIYGSGAGRSLGNVRSRLDAHHAPNYAAAGAAIDYGRPDPALDHWPGSF